MSNKSARQKGETSSDESARTEYTQTYKCPAKTCGFNGTLSKFIFDEETIDLGEIFVCRQCKQRIPKSQLIEAEK